MALDRGRRRSSSTRGRVLKARLRRPRKVLRRSGFVEVPFANAAVGGLQRRAAQAGDRKASMECGPGTVEGFGAIVKMRREGAQRRAAGDAGARRPTSAARRSARRYRAHRYRRPARQHVHGDAVWRLAAILAGHSGAGLRLGTGAQMFWLDEGHPASLAPGKRPRSNIVDAWRDARATVPGLGHARRRPAGPADLPAVPASRPSRHEIAGGHRRAGLALRAFPDLVWPRTARPGVLRDREACAQGNPRRTDRRGHIVEVEPDWSEGRLTAASKDGKRRKRRRQTARHARRRGRASVQDL